jgi:hypothetical protein
MKTSGRNMFDGFDAYASDSNVIRKKEWTLALGSADIVANSLRF